MSPSPTWILSHFAGSVALGMALVSPDVGLATPDPTPACPSSTLTSTDCVASLVVRLIDRSFPELRDAAIEVETFRSRNVFFRSRPRTLEALSPERRFLVGVNPVVFERGLPLAAAEAILAHELAHTVRYVEDGLPGILDTLWGRISARHAPDVERDRDLEAIARGYGPGLVQYRRELYTWLGPRDLARKQRNYLTPEEIERAMAIAGDAPYAQRLARRDGPQAP